MRQFPTNIDRSSEDSLENVLGLFLKLHAKSVLEKPDHERILDGMSSQLLGEFTLKAANALMHEECQLLERQAEIEAWSPALLEAKKNVARQDIMTHLFSEHWYESTLSTSEHPIHARTYGETKLKYDLRLLMSENPSPRDFDRFGWIMFDVNGLRSFKDCTSHIETTRYLQKIVQILLNPDGPTHQWARLKGIEMIRMATGGDEFVLYVKGRSPLSSSDIQSIVRSYQHEVETNESLTAMLNFDDPETIRQYGLPSSQLRFDFDQLTQAEQEDVFKNIRKTLPRTFIPSIAGDGALLSEGVHAAIALDPHDLKDHQDFSLLREDCVQAMIKLAEDRQKLDKDRRKLHLREHNPLQFAWEQRTKGNQILAQELLSVEARLQSIRQEYSLLLQLSQDAHFALFDL